MKRTNGHFLLFLIIIAGIGTFFVMKPFLVSIFLAFMLATMFSKANKKLAKRLRGHTFWSSILMCIWVMIVLIVPLFIVTAMTINEADQIIKETQSKNINFNFSFLENLPILESLDIQQASNDAVSQLTNSIQDVGNYLFTAVKAIYSGASKFIFMLVVCFFALYYFFKDGDMILRKIMDLSPLPDYQEKEVFEKFNTMTIATIKGTLIIALVQGVLLGVTFWIAGVQAPTLWGLLTAIISIIPLLGAFLVWLPVGIFLLAIGNYWQAILVLIVGSLIISSVDNFLRPKLIEGETSLHPLLVFLSTLGGIAFFGPLGFVIGPVVITLLISFLEIYQTGHVQS